MFAASLAVAVIGLAGCSSDDPASGPEAAGDTAASSTSAAPAPERTCDQGATTDELETAPVDGIESDLTLTSHDGTEIRMHWFPADGVSADAPAPTVLMGPGWSLPGSIEDTETVMFGALDIGSMNREGYNVLTWDPRGFGESGGVASVNDPDLEGKDAQLLLDWVAEQPEARTDADGDPRVGMVGFSYGGGIQLTLAGIDCRVDAIVPGIAWNSLTTALFRAETVKTGWAGVLVNAASSGTVDAHTLTAHESGTATGTLSDEDREWFTARGPGELIDQIRVPTLLVQGTVDTLFTPDEAILNYEVLAGNDVPLKMLWFCGGHGVCLTDEGDTDRVTEASFAWLERWVKGDTSIDTGPAIDVIDQDGTGWTGDAWPPAPGEPLSAEGTGTLPLVAEGGARGIQLDDGQGGILGGLVLDITPAPAENAVNVAIEATEDTLVVGAPQLTLTYRGDVADGDRPMRLFAQVVDDENGVVVGNQITPFAVELDGREHTVTVPLESIIHHLEAGETLTLQVVATTGAYAEPRLGGEVSVTSMTVSLPTTTALTAD
ncbi:MAG TPA: CocE/NonD family hydrolase [Acidimicrobiales bacterium]|nr:CocE/NonD family hydrolase [Acidimicrobiales bacterium]